MRIPMQAIVFQSELARARREITPELVAEARILLEGGENRMEAIKSLMHDCGYSLPLATVAVNTALWQMTTEAAEYVKTSGINDADKAIMFLQDTVPGWTSNICIPATKTAYR